MSAPPAAQGSPYTVRSPQLNCHDGADLNTPVREQLVQNATVNVVTLEGAWAKLHRAAWDCWVKAEYIAPANGSSVATQPGEVALVDDGGGTFRVPVQIDDGLTVNFTVDSGASDVSIPADVASVMFRQGVITQADFIGDKTFELADGSTLPSKEFRIKTLKVGDLVLQEVTASLAPAQSEPLLGQSFLSRVASWSLDNNRHVLLLNKQPDSGAAVAAQQLVTSFYQAWSGSDADSAVNIRPYFANKVIFYGSPLSLDDLMAKQAQFAARWPVRSYTVRPQTLVSTCSPDGACEVDGLVDWNASSPTDGRNATGVAQFKFVVQGGVFVAENGQVVSRQRSDQVAPGAEEQPSTQSEPDSPPD
jgi:clan AA aspartic protease (TIGR02281 family)